MVNFSNLPYLDITLLIPDAQNTSNWIDMDLGMCNVSKFLKKEDYDSLSKETQEEITKKMSFYLCPIDNFSIEFVNSFYVDNFNVLLLVEFKNTSVLEEAEDDLNNMRYKFSFIFADLAINSDNRKDPYSNYLDSFEDEINFDMFRKKIVNICPFEMQDDNHLFGVGAFERLDTNYSDQPNKTVFTMKKGSDRSILISNRSQPVSANGNHPQLYLYNIKLKLDPTMTTTLRSYQKFTDVLAGVSSLLSTGMIFLSIFMNHYNTVQGKNNMVQSLYTNEGMHNIKSFSIDLNEIINGPSNVKNVISIYLLILLEWKNDA